MSFQYLALVLILVPTLYLVADFTLTWTGLLSTRDIYYYNKRDVYFVLFFIMPAILSHLVTIWGHYYRADSIFQESIVQATSSKKKRVTFWERHDPWMDYTYKYWVLVAIATFLNLVWFFQPVIAFLPPGIKHLGLYAGITAYLAFGTGYAAMGACGMLLLLVLRRSMLQALGFTYADLLPLHRGMGLAFLYWSAFHTVFYILYYIVVNQFWENFGFDGNTRGPQNLIALVAFAALYGLFYTSKPRFRRGNYILFITAHRIFTVVVFIGTLMHFPYYMIWYYVLPSVCLYLADRFVPKYMQASSIAPEVYYSFNKEADILTAVLVSKNSLEPLKPYYPGDYVNLEIPQLSMIPHPFTIASYWAEDPYTMTIYIRTFQENESSWTGALARLCNEIEQPLQLKTKVDGVFGDRNHDYLSSRAMVIFSAGAAITTFMSLIKAIAAQIDAVSDTGKVTPIEVHLICTFRYESELYAYGDFMHRITHDPRFTSWLHTEVYVSRPDKFTPPTECPSGQCTSEFVCGRIDDDVSESTSLLAKIKPNYGSAGVECNGCRDKGCCMESGSSSNPSPCETVAQSISSLPEESQLYYQRTIPTFPMASSTAASTIHAKKDLAATSLMLVAPMIAFLWSRAIPWEGTYNGETRWCRTTRDNDQHMTNRCLWSYAVLPGILHFVVACLLGYLGLWSARRTGSTSTRSVFSKQQKPKAALDAYQNLLSGLSFLDPDQMSCPLDNNGVRFSDVRVPKGSIKFKRGRIQVNQHIQELKGQGIGCEQVRANGGKEDNGVIAFGGGPEAFVDMIYENCTKADWKVDFHRETWAP